MTLLVYFSFILIVTTESTFLSNLSKTLFEEYNPSVRPDCGNANETVSVSLDIALRQIIELDEPNQMIKLSIWIRMTWKDCRLRWDVEEHGGIEDFVIPAEEIWTPDMTLYDSSGQEFSETDGKRARVSTNSSVDYNFPVSTDVRCKVDVKYFPFDKQTCPLKFGLWLHNGGEVNIESKYPYGDLSSADENVEWRVLEFPNERHEVKYLCCEELYPDVTFYLKIKRKSTFYVLHIVVPYIIISGIGIFAYALPAESGEKVTVGITVLLSLTVFLLLLGDALPPYSNSIPLIAIYFDIIILLVCFSCFVSVLVLHYFFKPNTPLPSWIRTVFFRYLAKILFVEASQRPGQTSYQRVEQKLFRRTTVRLAHFQKKFQRNSSKCKRPIEKSSPVSKETFPVQMIHFEDEQNPVSVIENTPPVQLNKRLNGNDVQQSADSLPSCAPNPKPFNTDAEMGDGQRDYNGPTNSMTGEYIVTEWQILANVLDRLGLIIHSLSMFFSTFVILLILDLH